MSQLICLRPLAGGSHACSMRFVESTWNSSCSLDLFGPRYAELDGKETSPVLYRNSPSVKEHKKKQVLVERNPSSLNFVAHL